MGARFVGRLFIFFFVLWAVPAFGDCSDWDQLFISKGLIPRQIKADANDNVYMLGYVTGSGFVLGAYSFLYEPYADNYVLLKFDKDRNLVWGRRVADSNGGASIEMEIDQSNNIIVSGFYEGIILFGSIRLSFSTGQDLFVVKFSPDAVPLWAIRSTGSGQEYPTDMVISTNQNIIVSGTYTGSGVKIGGKALASFGGEDSFVASITPNGVVSWANGYGGTPGLNPDHIWGVDTDSQNNIVMTGTFASTQIRFGSTTLNLSVSGTDNSFLVKLNPAGTVLWAQAGDGDDTGTLWGTDVAVGLHDQIYQLARFGGRTTVGSQTVISAGGLDNYVCEMDPSGNVLAVQQLGGENYDWGTQVDVASDGHVVVSGFEYSNTFVAGPFHTSKTLPFDFGSDIFVIEYTEDLTPACAHFVTGRNGATTFDMSIDPSNNIWLGIDFEIFDYFHDNNFDSRYTLDDANISFIGARIGHDPDLLVWPTAPLIPPDLVVSLGPDILKCRQQTVTLTPAPPHMNAQYQWSNGSTQSSINQIAAGWVWVDVTWQGQTKRDSVLISNIAPLDVTLGDDQKLCAGNAVSWNLPLIADATYTWSDGDTSPSKTVTTPGTYSVELSNACETVSASIVISGIAPLRVTLGANQKLCAGKTASWNLTPIDDATYTWNYGDTSPSKTAAAPGTYSVELTNVCETVSASVLISYIAPLNVTLGDDQTICPGDAVSWSLTPTEGAIFAWNDGDTSPSKTVKEPGTYSVKVTNVCETISTSTTIALRPMPVVNLGDDRKICGETGTLAYEPQADETLQWSNGSTLPSISVSQSGTYTLEVSNTCGTSSDAVSIQLVSLEGMTLPNVITPNGDNKNEYFVLPDALHDSGLRIYNRWGETVYQTSAYQNDWPQGNFATGVYFYTLQGECVSALKGSLHVVD